MNAENSEIKSCTPANPRFWRDLAGRNPIDSADFLQVNATSQSEMARTWADEAELARLENEAYRALWFHGIEPLQNENQQLRQAFEEQRQVLNEWIISQETFRSLAGEFRKRLGISDDDVKSMVEAARVRAVKSCAEQGLTA